MPCLRKNDIMKFYLISSDHLEDRVWFRDKEDFVAGMNYVAVLADTLKTAILDFILMSNHVHFFLQCEYDEAKYFIDRYKSLYGRYFCKKYRLKKFLHDIKVDIKEVEWKPEKLESACAYIQMNCVAANICVSPELYLWGSGNSFFNQETGKGRRLGDISRRAQIRLLHSNEVLNPDMIVGEDGFILPKSYLKVKFVESVFRTPKRMLYFRSNSSKAKATLDKKIAASVSFSDQTLIMAINDLCRGLYQITDAKYLTREQKEELAHHLHRFFKADAHQIARLLGFSYAESTSVLESFHT